MNDIKRAIKLIAFLVSAYFLFGTSPALAQPIIHEPGYQVELLASGLGAATGMTLSAEGDLYVTDNAGFRVLRVSDSAPNKPRLSEVYASGIPYPNDLAFAFRSAPKKPGRERLFVTSPTSANSQVVEVLSDGTKQTFATGFSYPVGIAAFGDFIYVANSGDGTISRADHLGVRTTFLSGFGGPNGPFGLSFDAAGNLYFVVHGTGEVYRASPSGTTQRLGSVSAFGGVFVAAMPDGSSVLVSDVSQGSLYIIDSAGRRTFASGFAGKSNPPYNGPNDIVIDRARGAEGLVYVADAGRVWRISKERGRR